MEVSIGTPCKLVTARRKPPKTINAHMFKFHALCHFMVVGLYIFFKWHTFLVITGVDAGEQGAEENLPPHSIGITAYLEPNRLTSLFVDRPT